MSDANMVFDLVIYCGAPSATRTRPTANPKIGELPGVRQHPAERQRSRVRVESRLCGGVEGDLVAEGFELADVVALAAFGVDAGGVVAGSEVAELGIGIG
jgi:hypothetical protein